MNLPVCSIIIPTYNHGKYIERSVESALAQTYKNVEIIVVDDGSTDDTPEKVKKFGNAVKYIRKENTGRGDNRNVAIVASKGKYIQFLDADDYISDNKLELQVQILEHDATIAAVYSDCSCTGPDGKALENVSYPLKDEENQIQILLKRTLFGIHAALIKRAVVMEVGMFDTDNLAQEDWDLWLKIALRGYKYKYVPGDLAHYDQVGSATVTNSPLMYKRTVHMLNKYLNDPAFCKLGKNTVNEFIAYQSISLATRAYNNQWWMESRKYFLKAKQANPKIITKAYKACITKTFIHQLADFLTGKKRKVLG